MKDLKHGMVMIFTQNPFYFHRQANKACTDEVGSQGCTGNVDKVGGRGTKTNNVPLALLRGVQKC